MENFDIFNIALAQLQLYMLVAIRVSAIFLTAPILGSRNIPVIAKIAFAFIFAMLIFPVLDTADVKMPADVLSYGIIILNQVINGGRDRFRGLPDLRSDTACGADN